MPTNDDDPTIVQPYYVRKDLDPHRFDDDPEAAAIHRDALRRAEELEKRPAGDEEFNQDDYNWNEQ